MRRTAGAALPPGPGEVPAGAPRLVFCEHEPGAGYGFRIYALEPDGRRRFLAGGSGTAGADGPGETARFPRVLDLALDRRGNVYVSQGGDGIRKINPDGRVEAFGPVDPEGGDRAVRHAECLVVDPATGELYVGEYDRLVKLASDGTLTKVIGGRTPALARSRGRALAPLKPGQVPLDTRFGMQPHQLAIHGRELVMVGQHGIDAFHLDSRRLARILPFKPHLLANRLGPVPYLNPQLGPERCAAVTGCGPLALSKEALCIVAMGQGLAELELPDDPLTTVMDPPGRAQAPGGPAEEPKQGAGSASLGRHRNE